MTVHGRAEKRDAVEPAIVAVLRRVGASVRRLSAPGLPDLIVAYHGRVVLLEVKRRGGKLTPAQRKLIAEGWPVVTVECPVDALMAIGSITAETAEDLTNGRSEKHHGRTRRAALSPNRHARETNPIGGD